MQEIKDCGNFIKGRNRVLQTGEAEASLNIRGMAQM
jgi:hypothetical protein